MGDKATPLWDGNTLDSNEIRLPKCSPNMVLNDESKNSKNTIPSSIENIVAKSKLSVDAPEFYPPNYQPLPSTNIIQPAEHSIQSRLKKHKVVEPSNSDGDFADSSDDIRLRHLITTLTKQPGQFEDLVDLFLDTLYPYFEDIFVLSRAAQLLVGQAVECTNFRYTAARLCCSIEQQCPTFRAELHIICKKELQQTTNKCGLLLFVAELYMQMHHENIYGSYLIEAFKHLLDLGGNDNVKAVCQALKLTGCSLELYDKKALDYIFEKLAATKQLVNGTASILIESVTNLRNSKWGHSNNSPIKNNEQQSEQENYYWDDIQNTVFYNTDGTKFTAEENEFLAANLCAGEEYLTDTSDPDELCDPEPEMDEEIQAAFKDFVKLSKR